MTHISVTQGAATWGDHVTDDEYGRGASRADAPSELVAV
jgi:hypothetical protein